ncbi:Isobutyryl-CoA dehydrogenase, mitochondrial [Verticillium nonalfalfae]|uniref:Isobutyryl-CoA dehydrogenase, mitochondrial n=1 Tax=Verticillium nonalfalfae TaxID=1051616 RepID=A0A3M9YIT4_9PEZI|nr:Isobutyryl-CoA dehydrogenase, mitochondrial [Verticillium nonalfalfae]RNJ60329.1 Isobutyryl-CoA dehydrogenase, mitochondrial [Verticillium nonalfalfae]
MSVLSENIKTNWVFGSPLPFAEAPWARGCPSPYYKESHRRLRQAMRAWVDKHLLPHVQDWEIAATLPDGLYEQAAKDGLLMPMASGAKVHPEWKGKYPIIGDVPAVEWDGFHDLIIHDEFGRIGGIGVENGLVGGVTLAVPALQKFGSEKLKKTVVHDILSGRARIALAITEPEAGSDVQGLQTEARLSDDGSHFIINGQKKWITSGMYSNYFLALVKETTGDMTLLVIPRTEGLTTRHMTMSGSTAAGTAFVDLDEVHVPIDMVVGERGKGFKYIVSNFNHERLFIGFQALRCARVCLEDSISYSLSRETFGKKLVEHPVIRFKFANMSRETEALQSWIESLIYQLSQLAPAEADLLLAGTTAQLKAHSGIVLEHVVREAVQILGGIGLTRGGRGERVERIWRDVKAITVPGGSEEILLDLATRRALKISDELRQVTGKGVKSRM